MNIISWLYSNAVEAGIITDNRFQKSCEILRALAPNISLELPAVSCQIGYHIPLTGTAHR